MSETTGAMFKYESLTALAMFFLGKNWLKTPPYGIFEITPPIGQAIFENTIVNHCFFFTFF